MKRIIAIVLICEGWVENTLSLSTPHKSCSTDSTREEPECRC